MIANSRPTAAAELVPARPLDHAWEGPCRGDRTTFRLYQVTFSVGIPLADTSHWNAALAACKTVQVRSPSACRLCCCCETVTEGR